MLTNPALNFIVLTAAAFVPVLATGAVGVVFVLTLEALVVLVEWGLLVWSLREDPARMLLVSLITNGASFGFGLLLQVLGLW